MPSELRTSASPERPREVASTPPPKTSAPRERAPYLTALGLAMIYLTAPVFFDPYGQTIIVVIGIGILLATSWNLLAQTGQVSLGHAAFVGVGAYVTALLVPEAGLVVSVATILFAGMVTAALGVLVGIITLRLAPWVLSIVTLAIAETLHSVARKAEWLTGGPAGLFSRNSIGADRALSVWVVGFLVLLAFALACAVRRSKWHYFFSAVRLDERAAAMCGIRVERVRIGAAALSGLIAGWAGGFYSLYIGFLDPGAAFDLHFSVESQAFPIVGGLYTLLGPVLGAIFLGGAEELARVGLGNASLLVYGIVLTTFILVAPRGLVGIWHSLRRLGAAARGSNS